MHEAKDYSSLLGTSGFSDSLLKDHFSLYEGYVANMNKVADLLREEGIGTLRYSELKRRFGWEWNGMRLHELYFGNLSKEAKPIDENGPLFTKITETFDGFDLWEKDFRAIAAMRGIGWVILAYDPTEDELFNVWINEHDGGHLAGAVPILVMDVFEHAYIRDYGIKRTGYIDAYMKSVDWDTVRERYEKNEAS